ncbi:hypothetical protein [Carnimonas bestiolae]|uniref:hypothetical protein n=1 Tax=Carnimonas bestiolae TaxID=3402172 RepID=UPI003F4A90DE
MPTNTPRKKGRLLMLFNGWMHTTKIGNFYIVENPRDGPFYIFYKGKQLGKYFTPQQAVDELVQGVTWSLPNGVDTETLNFPDDIEDWHQTRLQNPY